MSFIAGFTSGFMGGFAGAFTASSLNTWANGGSFGDGFGNGVGSGFVGGYTGGLVNGTFSGVKAVRNNRDFWGGREWREVRIGFDGSSTNPFREAEEFIRDWDVDVSLDIPTSTQNGNECMVGCKRAIDGYFGLTDQSTVNSKWSAISINNDGLTQIQSTKMFRQGGYTGTLFSGSFSKEELLSWMAGEMRSDHPVIVSASVDGGTHANVIRRIRYLEDFSRFRISSMNPINGAPMNIRSFSNYNSVFSVWRN